MAVNNIDNRRLVQSIEKLSSYPHNGSSTFDPSSWGLFTWFCYSFFRHRVPRTCSQPLVPYLSAPPSSVSVDGLPAAGCSVYLVHLVTVATGSSPQASILLPQHVSHAWKRWLLPQYGKLAFAIDERECGWLIFHGNPISSFGGLMFCGDVCCTLCGVPLMYFTPVSEE